MRMKNGVRIAQLDEKSYRKLLWDYRPITDFWRVGPGYEETGRKRNVYHGRCGALLHRKKTDYYNEDLLYKLFGVNAELLIDHAWGGTNRARLHRSKAYRPQANSSGSGQVLQCPYPADKKQGLLCRK